MMTRKDVVDLEEGDVIEHWALFPGITEEPLKLEVKTIVVTDTMMSIGFWATYFGVRVGIFGCFSALGNDSLQWSDLS